MQANGVRYQRFSVLHRILHFIVMLGFTVLAATGLTLAFSGNFAARAFASVLGGAAALAGWHKWFAVITYSCVIVHGLWFIYYKSVLRGKLTGPHSIAPSRRDVGEFVHHLRFVLGRSKTPPRFERFTYLEKIDYWAVFVGMNTMGLTGLLLWFPEFFSSFLPGFFVNIARILHFFEALLAIVIKFIIHGGMAHFRPSVYPGDSTIFSGKTTEAKMKAEHPLEWERLKGSEAPAAGEKP